MPSVTDTDHPSVDCGCPGGKCEDAGCFPSPEEWPSLLVGVELLPDVVAEFGGGDPSLVVMGCD